jgi:hypothetical protein
VAPGNGFPRLDSGCESHIPRNRVCAVILGEHLEGLRFITKIVVLPPKMVVLPKEMWFYLDNVVLTCFYCLTNQKNGGNQRDGT